MLIRDGDPNTRGQGETPSAESVSKGSGDIKRLCDGVEVEERKSDQAQGEKILGRELRSPPIVWTKRLIEPPSSTCEN